MFKKQVWYIIGLVIIVVAVYASSEYYRKPSDLTGVKPAYIISADSLVAAFEQNETLANEKYSGKVLQVRGFISSVSYSQDTLVSIILGDGFHKVGCLMDTREPARLGRNQELNAVQVKGFCTGYLMDVELTRCVLIK